MDVQRDIADILATKPFSRQLTILEVAPVDHPRATTGESFFIRADKGWFKLRACQNERQAQEIERNVQQFAHIFPKFYGRDGRFLLFEKLEGFRNLTWNELKANLRRIGRIYAEIHTYGTEGSYDQRKSFFRRLEELLRRKIIDHDLYEQVRRAFERSLASVGDTIALELNDITEVNFMMNDAGEFYFVDEDGIGYRVKGVGIAKFLHRINYDEWKEFVAGYEEVADSKYITSPALLHHISIIEPVRSICAKMDRSGQEATIAKELGRLKRAVS